MLTKKTKKNPARQPLDLYLHEISRTPLLTTEEEQEIGRRIRTGDRDAFCKLVESNLRFVVKVAKRYRGYGVSLQDLINEGNVGLIEAARRFDPTRNVKFISYAVWWIRQSILVSLSTMCHPMRLPVRVSNILYKVAQTTSAKQRELGRLPSYQEIADEMGIDVRDLNSLLETAKHPVSFNNPVGHEEELVIENVVATDSGTRIEDQMVQQSVRDSVGKAMQELGEKEELVLRLRFGFDGESPRSLRQIGDRLGLSRERVRQIQQKALQKLRINGKTRSLLACCELPAAV